MKAKTKRDRASHDRERLASAEKEVQELRHKVEVLQGQLNGQTLTAQEIVRKKNEQIVQLETALAGEVSRAKHWADRCETQAAETQPSQLAHAARVAELLEAVKASKADVQEAWRVARVVAAGVKDGVEEFLVEVGAVENREALRILVGLVVEAGKAEHLGR